MNLMLNGIEAIKDSGGELTVKSELQDGQLQFSVSDTGVGLPTEKMDQIFSAFFYHQALGQRHGIGHQPFHCGVAWRAVAGKRQRWRRRNFSFHTTDPSHGVVALSCLRHFGPPLSIFPLIRLPSFIL